MLGLLFFIWILDQQIASHHTPNSRSWEGLMIHDRIGWVHQRWGKKLFTDINNTKLKLSAHFQWRDNYINPCWLNKLPGKTKQIPAVAHYAMFFNDRKYGREIVWVWNGTALNFFVFLAAECYYTRVYGYKCLSGIYQQLGHQQTD